MTEIKKNFKYVVHHGVDRRSEIVSYSTMIRSHLIQKALYILEGHLIQVVSSEKLLMFDITTQLITMMPQFKALL